MTVNAAQKCRSYLPVIPRISYLNAPPLVPFRRNFLFVVLCFMVAACVNPQALATTTNAAMLFMAVDFDEGRKGEFRLARRRCKVE